MSDRKALCVRCGRREGLQGQWHTGMRVSCSCSPHIILRVVLKGNSFFGILMLFPREVENIELFARCWTQSYIGFMYCCLKGNFIEEGWAASLFKKQSRRKEHNSSHFQPWPAEAFDKSFWPILLKVASSWICLHFMHVSQQGSHHPQSLLMPVTPKASL